MHKVSIVPCSSYDQAKVNAAVRKAIEDIGFDIRPGSKVLLKPNVLTSKRPDEAVTTHPAVVEAVCRFLNEKGCKIIIAESSGFYSTLKNFETAGIAKVAKKYNAELVSLAENLMTKKIPDARVLKETQFSKTLFSADLIINLPKMKTHSLTKYTGAVKNLYGCIPGVLKQKYHVKAPNEKKFCQLLVDVYSIIKPGLTIMDGIIGMEGNGPSGGEPKKAGLIMASDNAPALDYIAEKIMGIEGMVYTTRFAAARGFFRPDEVKVIGKIPKIRFKRPESSVSFIPGFLREAFFVYTTPEPVLIEEKCMRCGNCVKVCMSKAIKLDPYPVFRRSRCIHCYCCHEMCPYNAIELKKKKMIEILESIKRKL